MLICCEYKLINNVGLKRKLMEVKILNLFYTLYNLKHDGIDTHKLTRAMFLTHVETEIKLELHGNFRQYVLVMKDVN